MTTAIQPARGLATPGHDPRPCLNKPPQWWDLGNEGNVRAIRYCRNVCPLLSACAAGIPGLAPKSQIRAGRAFNDYGKRVRICAGCDRPRSRRSSSAPITCGCTRRPERRAAA